MKNKKTLYHFVLDKEGFDYQFQRIISQLIIIEFLFG